MGTFGDTEVIIGGCGPGFGTGGATLEDVKLMKANVAPFVKLKAAGGMKTKEDLFVFLEAGADRLGTSSGIKLLNE